jgi:hypothetical protein
MNVDAGGGDAPDRTNPPGLVAQEGTEMDVDMSSQCGDDVVVPQCGDDVELRSVSASGGNVDTSDDEADRSPGSWTTVRHRKNEKDPETVGVFVDDISEDIDSATANVTPQAAVSDASMAEVRRFINDLEKEKTAPVVKQEPSYVDATEEEAIQGLDWNAEKEAEEAAEAEERARLAETAGPSTSSKGNASAMTPKKTMAGRERMAMASVVISITDQENCLAVKKKELEKLIQENEDLNSSIKGAKGGDYVKEIE